MIMSVIFEQDSKLSKTELGAFLGGPKPIT
jgi:hypothetical protein